MTGARKKAHARQARNESAQGAVIVHGDFNITTNHYDSRDSKHHAEIEGKGEIVSPAPVLLKADLRAKGAGSATLKRPPAASDNERPQ